MDEELPQILEQLLHSIRKGDVDFYNSHVSEELTCIEPESQGNIVTGLPFHEFFMNNFQTQSPYHLELVNPIIKTFGDFGYTTYTLLILKKVGDNAEISRVNETRIWSKQSGVWKMIHFHRSG